jgi:hypothetical protein
MTGRITSSTSSIIVLHSLTKKDGFGWRMVDDGWWMMDGGWGMMVMDDGWWWWWWWVVRYIRDWGSLLLTECCRGNNPHRHLEKSKNPKSFRFWFSELLISSRQSISVALNFVQRLLLLPCWSFYHLHQNAICSWINYSQEFGEPCLCPIRPKFGSLGPLFTKLL